jgi:dihydrofolate reductase
MRRIVIFDRVSADGYFSARDGNLDWVVPEPELDQMAASSLEGSDAMLFGRKTYQMFESFWPHAVTDSPTTRDPHGPVGSREMRTLGIWINAATKVVFSKTLKKVTWNNSRLIHEFDPRAIVAMKKEPGKDMMVFGSGTLVAQLVQAGLIDEYHLVVSPVLLGGGRSFLDGLAQRSPLKLLELKQYPSGNVMLRYAPATGS